jgi:hypothetical protein
MAGAMNLAPTIFRCHSSRLDHPVKPDDDIIITPGSPARGHSLWTPQYVSMLAKVFFTFAVLRRGEEHHAEQIPRPKRISCTSFWWAQPTLHNVPVIPAEAGIQSGRLMKPPEKNFLSLEGRG